MRPASVSSRTSATACFCEVEPMLREAIFLQAIRDVPDDDTPRLVYADWLEDQGKADSLARAEFIRVQIALSHLPQYDPRRPALEDRESDLLAEHEEEWLGDVPEKLHFWR